MNNKYVRITPPNLVKNHQLGAKIIFTIFLFNIFLILISSTYSLPNQKEDCTIFLENLMIREGGLYTLLGSKPMTLFNVTDTIDASEEGLAQSYAEAKEFSEKAKEDPEHYHVSGSTMPDYDTYKKECLTNYNSMIFTHKKKMWEAWLIYSKHFSNSTYKLFSRPLSREKANIEVGLFINVPQALHILKKYRIEFCQITGMEFDTDKILDSIEDKGSFFWDRVLTNHYLLGLLLGYGEKNAYLFDWVRKNSLLLQSVSILRFPELSSLNLDTKQIMKKNVTINDLPIPYFVSFEINDKEIERYTQEREKIIDFLKDKDFVAFALNCLDSKRP